MNYRVEKKYLVTEADLVLLTGRLNSVMAVDEHQDGNCYQVRSVYFDDFRDRCMDENEAGVDLRQKYRIRTYGASSDVVRLEIKEKRSELTKKASCLLTKQEAERLIKGSLPFAMDERKELNLLQLQMRCNAMQSKVVIDYERTAFVHPAGNVRVTFDRNIRAGVDFGGFFAERLSGMIPVLPAGVHVLEVKYDEFLPDFIAKELQLRTLRQTSFSKYYLGRLALRGAFPVER